MDSAPRRYPQARRDFPPLKVWVLPGERAVIEERAKAHGMPISTYVRAVVLAMPVRTVVDHEKVDQLLQVSSNLGRLGGLLKMWLASPEREVNYERVTKLLGLLEENRELLRAKIKQIERL